MTDKEICETRTAKRDARTADHRRRLGSDESVCHSCGETAEAALTIVAICAECLAEAMGKFSTEDHHVAGRKNDPTTLTLPANDHRILSDEQHDWPSKMLRNPEASPLVRAAACVQGVVDALWLFMKRLLGWIPDALLHLNELLCERLGPGWWRELGWEVPTR